MPIRKEPSQPTSPEWEQTPGFRETTLSFFPSEEAAALRRVGRLMHDLITEADLRDEEMEKESPTRRELRAALADLRHLQSYLAEIGGKTETTSLEKDDTRLALHADEAAKGLARVVGRLTEVLESPHSGALG
jgi:hypothetical protein